MLHLEMRWKIAQQLEHRWWRNYLKGKDPAAYLEWKQDYWLHFLDRCGIEMPTNKPQVLDAGCGPAGIYSVLDRHNVVAIDPLLEAYDKLDHFERRQYPWVRFITSTIEDFQIPQTFDWVFCLNAINHVEDIHRGYDRLVEALKPNGTLIMSIDAHNYRFPKWLFRSLPLDALHPHQYTLDEYKNVLVSRGVQIERIELIKEERIFNYYAIVAKRNA